MILNFKSNIIIRVKKAERGVEDAADSENDSSENEEGEKMSQRRKKLNDKSYFEEQAEIKKRYFCNVQ